MSSREIAELTGKEHKNVIRDIRVLMLDLEDGSDLSHVRADADERGYTACFHLPKDLTITLVAGYSVPLRHRIVTRWLELESQAGALTIPKTFSAALRLAAETQERLEQAEINPVSSTGIKVPGSGLARSSATADSPKSLVAAST